MLPNNSAWSGKIKVSALMPIDKKPAKQDGGGVKTVVRGMNDIDVELAIMK